jgi:hypothetical protein
MLVKYIQMQNAMESDTAKSNALIPGNLLVLPRRGAGVLLRCLNTNKYNKLFEILINSLHVVYCATSSDIG